VAIIHFLLITTNLRYAGYINVIFSDWKMKNIKSKTIPNCLKRYRKARGLQQKQVAKILGFKCTSTISRWEKGYCMPNTINLFKLSIIYRTISDSLFIDLIRNLKSDIHQREEKILSKR